MNTENTYAVVATKVRQSVKAALGRICKKRGINEYVMLQMMCDCVVRYGDDRHNLSEEMERVMSVFEHMIGWRDALNLADPTTNMEVGEAVYILQAEKGKRKGARAVMVSKPYFGEWNQTANVQQIVERVIEVCLPERYRRLRALAQDMDCNSIIELLDSMIDAHVIDSLSAECRREFEDSARAENGQPLAYGERTKRKHHKGIDMLDKQQTAIHFDKSDVPDLPELENGNDLENNKYKPHGYEW